jgi:predicted O-linked N-acetylglucosamine transferase (SPINDLY family)
MGVAEASALVASGRALLAAGRVDAAVAHFDAAVRAHPESGRLRAELAGALFRAGRHRDASNVCCQAIADGFQHSSILNNLGSILGIEGRVSEAVEAFRAAMLIDPGSVVAHSNLLLALQCLDGIPPGELFQEHRRFGARFTAARRRKHPNREDPERKLNIGYVSGSFRRHPVAQILEPVLREHCRRRYALFAYSNYPLADEVTERLKTAFDVWRGIHELDDRAAAERIRADRIDVLIDLDGHSSGNRLPLFALKPAPVQATWLGYPGTTGLSQMDYRITDAVSDPAGAEEWHTERLLRIEPLFLAFQPPAGAPEVGPAPILNNGRITFGSFNQLRKLSSAASRLMARVLVATPGSNLLLKSRALADDAVRGTVQARFAECGIPPDRVECLGLVADQSAHLALYNEVDIALDPAPYNGTTTTCEALWMGVPVITLEGDRHAARVGCTLLRAAGLSQFIASDEGAYVGLAAALASDCAHLARLRAQMRATVAASRLCDVAGFAGRLERVFRTSWTDWCRTARERRSFHGAR